MRITSKGQVTIPQAMREAAGLLPETEVEFELDGSTVRIRRALHANPRGTALVEHLRGKGSVSMTTDEIMRLTRGDA